MTSLDSLVERLRERVENRLRRTDLELSGPQYFLRTSSVEKIRAARKERADRTRVISHAFLRGEATKDELQREILAASSILTKPVEWLELEPLSTWKLREAEQELGFAFPEALGTVYCQVANGGFGPGYGLLPIHLIVGEYRELKSAQVGPPWPDAVLPITDGEGERYCIDVATREIVRYDVYWPDDEDGEPSLTFIQVATSLESWLKEWLDYDPDVEQAQIDELVKKHGTPEWFEAWVVRVRALSPEQRAKLGRTETDWEERARQSVLKRS